jgi:hypothetical protein
MPRVRTIPVPLASVREFGQLLGLSNKIIERPDFLAPIEIPMIPGVETV